MKCFVIMPFGDPQRDPRGCAEFDYIYTHCIKRSVESVTAGTGERIECHRADEEHRPGEVMAHVAEWLAEADLVIADLSSLRPNVFYELGIRHALRNGTIILARQFDDIPFDLRGMRAIRYDYDPISLETLKLALTEAICSAIASTHNPDNPVRRYLLERDSRQLAATPNLKSQEIVQAVAAELNATKEIIAEQLRELRALVTHTTETPSKADQPNRAAIARFEGAWLSLDDTRSKYFAKVVHGELRVVYQYGNRSGATSHFYNLQLVGGQLVGRFAWFENNIEGCVILHEKTINRLIGAWWYLGDIPTSLRSEISLMPPDLPGRNPLRLARVLPTPDPFPAWAVNYFESIASRTGKHL